MRAVGWGTALATIAWAGAAHATAGTAFSESSRAASLADAASALPGDAGTMLLNPAGLSDVREPLVEIGAHVDRLDGWFARTGEPKDDRSRTFGGFSVAAATPLPGPEFFRRFGLGLALDMPAAHALRVSVPVRLDDPSSLAYDGRPDRMSAIGALGFRLCDRVRLGAGVSLTPSLATPTEVSYVAGRDPAVERSVEVRLDRNLELGVTPFVGVRAQPLDVLSLAIVYRDAAISRASGSQRTVAGGILADDPIDFYQMWDPAELVVGAAFFASPRVSLSADATLHRWSQKRDGFDRELAQPLHDTVSVRAGVEWRAARAIVLRAGSAIEPSPLPEQYGDANTLGANAMTFALGGGVDLRELFHAPLRLDAHVRARFEATQSATKRPGALADADPSTPGKQIDNLGYPSFQSSARFLQAGLTLTLFVGKERR